jgi:Mlc titration factor MtfA (ptsG expression regulator)
LNTRDIKAFYESHFHYFTTLNSQWQEVFVSRCEQLISDKLIIGAEGFEPDNKVKAIIAACAVQLTLGLETWKLEYFDTVIIHPGDFDNKASGKKFRGETNLAGYIRLSWQSFISGYKINDDNINLGLHEFSHALRFNSVRGASHDYFLEHYLPRWFAAAGEAYIDLKSGEQSIFRNYGGANINEFMSVCIEHFFESPDEIKAHYPMLYYCTAILLNQQTTGDITSVNVRDRLFEEQAALQYFVSPCNLKTAYWQTYSFIFICVLSIPFFYALMETGFNTGTMLLLCLMTFSYLIFDFKFTRVSVKDDGMVVDKGFLLFRGFSKVSVKLACIISLRMFKTLKGVFECELTYYKQESGYFYREDVIVKGNSYQTLLKEFRENKIQVFIK